MRHQHDGVVSVRVRDLLAARPPVGARSHRATGQRRVQAWVRVVGPATPAKVLVAPACMAGGGAGSGRVERADPRSHGPWCPVRIHAKQICLS